MSLRERRYMRHGLSRRRTVLDGHGDGLRAIASLDHPDHVMRQSHEVGHFLLQQVVQRGHGTSGEHQDVSGSEGLQIDGAKGERSRAEHLTQRQRDVAEGQMVVALHPLASEQTREEVLQTRNRYSMEKNAGDNTDLPPHWSR